MSFCFVFSIMFLRSDMFYHFCSILFVRFFRFFFRTDFRSFLWAILFILGLYCCNCFCMHHINTHQAPRVSMSSSMYRKHRTSQSAQYKAKHVLYVPLNARKQTELRRASMPSSICRSLCSPNEKRWNLPGVKNKQSLAASSW